MKLFTRNYTRFAAAALLCLSTFAAAPVLLVSCSSDEDEEGLAVEETKQEPEETVVCTEPGIPIRITTEYAAGTNMAAVRPIPFEKALGGEADGEDEEDEEDAAVPSRIVYSDSGGGVTAKWEAGDKIYVVCGGKISLLSLESGAGTKTGTFSGVLAGWPQEPADGTELVCYVRNSRQANAITVQANGTFKDNRNFQNQNGTLSNAALRIIYRGTARYSKGRDTAVEFKVHDTCLMRFDITASNGVTANTAATLRYNDGYRQATPLAMAAFKTDASMTNRVYMAVPSGSYGNAAYLGYTNETLQGYRSEAYFGINNTPSMLRCPFREIALGSNSSVTLKPGKFYSKAVKPQMELWDYIYDDGTWGTVRAPGNKTPIAGYAVTAHFLSPTDVAAGYTHGYALALEFIGPCQWGTYTDGAEIYDTNQMRERTDYLCSLPEGYGIAAKLARAYGNTHPTPVIDGVQASEWFLMADHMGIIPYEIPIGEAGSWTAFKEHWSSVVGASGELKYYDGWNSIDILWGSRMSEEKYVLPMFVL
ncbi:MAG: hypothetical protein J6M53_01680 [Bacteroidaceae bacterium]|nr:hypothetical protein [Bacteroidaceae bacterium]